MDDWPSRENPLERAERYRTVAVQYSDLAAASNSPFLCGFYRRIAEDYLARAEAELRTMDHRIANSATRITTVAGRHTPPSPGAASGNTNADGEAPKQDFAQRDQQ